MQVIVEASEWHDVAPPFRLDVTPSETIKRVKEKYQELLYEKYWFKVDLTLYHRFVWGGGILYDELKTLSDYNIKDGQILDLVNFESELGPEIWDRYLLH